MNTEKIEQLMTDLKNAFETYTTKKSFTTRMKVRKTLQAIKSEAQTFRVWLLKDFNDDKKDE